MFEAKFHFKRHYNYLPYQNTKERNEKRIKGGMRRKILLLRKDNKVQSTDVKVLKVICPKDK